MTYVAAKKKKKKDILQLNANRIYLSRLPFFNWFLTQGILLVDRAWIIQHYRSSEWIHLGDQSECFSSTCLISFIWSQRRYKECWSAVTPIGWICQECTLSSCSGADEQVIHLFIFLLCFLLVALCRKPAWPGYEYPRRGAPTPSSTVSAMACSTRLWSSQ